MVNAFEYNDVVSKRFTCNIYEVYWTEDNLNGFREHYLQEKAKQKNKSKLGH